MKVAMIMIPSTLCMFRTTHGAADNRHAPTNHDPSGPSRLEMHEILEYPPLTVANLKRHNDEMTRTQVGNSQCEPDTPSDRSTSDSPVSPNKSKSDQDLLAAPEEQKSREVSRPVENPKFVKMGPECPFQESSIRELKNGKYFYEQTIIKTKSPRGGAAISHFHGYCSKPKPQEFHEGKAGSWRKLIPIRNSTIYVSHVLKQADHGKFWFETYTPMLECEIRTNLVRNVYVRTRSKLSLEEFHNLGHPRSKDFTLVHFDPVLYETDNTYDINDEMDGAPKYRCKLRKNDAFRKNATKKKSSKKKRSDQADDIRACLTLEEIVQKTGVPLAELENAIAENGSR